MSSISMSGSGSKQVIRPPQRGVFPLDHEAKCKSSMEEYLSCLRINKDKHYECRDYSKSYLQCRMDNMLMKVENLNDMGYDESKKVIGAKDYDYAKEKAGFIAGKHIARAKLGEKIE